jgi:hypothetical protein
MMVATITGAIFNCLINAKIIARLNHTPILFVVARCTPATLRPPFKCYARLDPASKGVRQHVCLYED